MNTPDLKDRLRNANWVAPSAELRARILAEARVAHAAISWTDRLWFSRVWRCSALVATVALVAVAVWPGPAVPDPSLSTKQLAAIGIAEEVALDAGLEPGQAAAFARRAVVRARLSASARGVASAALLTEGGDR